MYMYVHVCVYMHMCVYMYVYVCMHERNMYVVQHTFANMPNIIVMFNIGMLFTDELGDLLVSVSHQCMNG